MNLSKEQLKEKLEEFGYRDVQVIETGFTTKNQFATLPDILGSERRINQPNVTAGNWSYRAAQEYEKQYFENLAQGQGLNTPDALSKAIKAKHGGHANGLTDKLDRFASILREKGPFTREEADRVYA